VAPCNWQNRAQFFNIFESEGPTMFTLIERCLRRINAARLPWHKPKKNKPHEPALESRFQSIVQQIPALQKLPEQDLGKLRGLVKLFLADKAFHGIHGVNLDWRLKLKIAVLACLPALHLGYGALEGWYDIVVYPDAFVATRQRVDGGSGAVHEYRETLLGEAWSQGPIVLAASEIERNFAHPENGQSVVLHEIAHKIDGLDRSVDGVPPMQSAKRFVEFQAAMRRSLAAFREQLQVAQLPTVFGVEDALDQDIHQPWIDPYGAKNAEEFFAVASETYFLAPERLQQRLPEAYRVLDQFYQQS
jgi:MtfA peptidase